jgi:hypothetical protein
LQTQLFPIRRTSAVAKSPIYSGDRDSVTVKATIQDTQRAILAEGKWEGPNLLLNRLTATSLRNCSGLSGLNKVRCEGLRTAENVTASAIAAGVLERNRQSRMIPFDPDKPLKIKIFDRDLLLLIVTATTSASANALSIAGDLYIRPFN